MIWYDMMSLSKKCWLLPWFVAFCWSWSAESYFDNAAPPNKSWRNPNCTVEITVKIQRICSFQRSPFQLQGPGQCLVAQEKMYSRPRSKPKPRKRRSKFENMDPPKNKTDGIFVHSGDSVLEILSHFPIVRTSDIGTGLAAGQGLESAMKCCLTAPKPLQWRTHTLQGTNKSNLGKRKIIFKSALKRGYVRHGRCCTSPMLIFHSGVAISIYLDTLMI